MVCVKLSSSWGKLIVTKSHRMHFINLIKNLCSLALPTNSQHQHNHGHRLMMIILQQQQHTTIIICFFNVVVE